MTVRTRTQGTCVAVTTTGGSWRVVCTGHDAKRVRDEAELAIAGDQWDKGKDIYVDTELKNLIVVSKTKAERSFRWAWEAYLQGDEES